MIKILASVRMEAILMTIVIVIAILVVEVLANVAEVC
jgi:hypothetical protein